MAKRLLDGSIRKSLVVLLLALIAWPAVAQDKSVEAWQRLSRLQSLLEYFFMETGVYPLDLNEMDQLFRSRAPRAPKPIGIPLDPATNQPFKYQVDPNGRRYSLAVPDPSKYGGAKIGLSAVDWGFLGDLADLRRFEEIVRRMTSLMKVTATQCEMYAKDHSGQYPAALDDLLPRYITRIPSDPLTGKNLAYKKLLDGYIISCPNPEKYGLKIFQYHSSSGIQMEQLPKAGASTPPAPAKADSPKPVDPVPPPEK